MRAWALSSALYSYSRKSRASSRLTTRRSSPRMSWTRARATQRWSLAPHNSERIIPFISEGHTSDRRSGCLSENRCSPTGLSRSWGVRGVFVYRVSPYRRSRIVGTLGRLAAAAASERRGAGPNRAPNPAPMAPIVAGASDLPRSDRPLVQRLVPGTGHAYKENINELIHRVSPSSGRSRGWTRRRRW